VRSFRRYRQAVAREQEQRSSSALAHLLVAKQAIGRLFDRVLPTRTKIVLRRLRIASWNGDTAARRASLGRLQLSIGRVDAAWASFLTAIALGSRDLSIHRGAVLQLYWRGRWDDMHDVMRRTIELEDQLAAEYGIDRSVRYIGIEFVQQLGCLAMLDVIAKQDVLAGHSPPTVILADPAWVSNTRYLDQWRPHFRTILNTPAEIARVAGDAELVRLYPHTWRAPDGRLLYFLDAATEVEEQWEAAHRPPLLQLDESEITAGWQCLHELGVPPGSWFASLHVREGEPYDTIRNADISTYDLAMKTVIERGGWIIRMGSATYPPLPAQPYVLDYAHSSAKSERMDVFLLSQARFMIGTESGPTAVAGTFGVPAVATNWLLPHRNWFRNHVYLPKLYYSKHERRFLTLDEAFASPVAFLPNHADLGSLGIEVVDNTPEEIDEAVVELIDVLDSHTVYTAEDDELQMRYRACGRGLAHPIPAGGARVGRSFLRDHSDLL
jgi:putative glycosyltransferase (TIGR04372 family)